MSTQDQNIEGQSIEQATEIDAAAKPRQPLWLSIWRNWIMPVGIAITLVMTFRSSFADWNDVPSQSMEPTILVGDRIFVNKLAYDLKVPFTTWRLAQWSDPEPGDIVIFYAPTDGRRMVKRIIGAPGDQIELRDNQLLINGSPVVYQTLPTPNFETTDLTDPGPYTLSIEQLGVANHSMMVQPMRYATRDFGPIKIPAGKYFVMGDNRDNSGDSRVFGFVPREEIVGKAIGLAFSLDQSHSYLPRWDRFFRGLM